MKKICAYCGTCYGDTGAPPPEGVPRDAVTHGICGPCFDRVTGEMDRAETRRAAAAEEARLFTVGTRAPKK